MTARPAFLWGWLGVGAAVAAVSCGASPNTSDARHVAPLASASSAQGPVPVVPGEVCKVSRAYVDAPPSAFASALRAWLSAPPAAVAGVPHAALTAMCDDAAHPWQGAACTALGLMLETGDGAPREPLTAARVLERAAMGNGLDVGGCHLGSPALTNGVTTSMTSCCGVARRCAEGCEAYCDRALERLKHEIPAALEEGCDGGRMAACFLLGELLAYGVHVEFVGHLVEQDSERSQALYERACAAGVGRACEALGHRLRYGVGDEPEDLAAAEVMYQKGCDLDAGPACQSLGGLIDERVIRVQSPDPNEPFDRSGVPLAAPAVSAYEKACRLGMRAVCRDLARMYGEGERVSAQADKAKSFAALAEQTP